MKKYIPLLAIVVFIAAMLGLSNYIWTQQEIAKAQKAYEAERHLVVYSDMPNDVNTDIAAAFYERTHMRVQIYSKTDSQISDFMEDSMSHQPDILIASEPALKRQQAKGRLKPYASEVTEHVPYTFKDADGNWTGLWYNPLVFVLSKGYYEQQGQHINTWDDLLTDFQLTLVFPDLASMDIAGDFLCSIVESRGLEETGLYLKELQTHVAVYSKSMSTGARRVASGEADMGVLDAATARQYSMDGAPLVIVYPRDGTSYWLTGGAITKWCEDDELSHLFMDWLYSEDVNQILRKNHIYLSGASDTASKELDVKGQDLVLLPVKKDYTEQGRREIQDWWLKNVRFGKES
ncbi:MAG: extracellular solute-binding protein [Megasphaera sp.]|jgi:iron(III) transport system substrate-binding protein|nr:extracellular solute-binding protein [Megasphaera sp.]MCH4187093.1 extracellular solute-binding protein [Megasphaera sp.]MCH4216971.1 extracellular solute-binding protein [Megasphaera sp.]